MGGLCDGYLEIFIDSSLITWLNNLALAAIYTQKMRETILKGISANLPEQLQQSEQMLDEVKAVEDRYSAQMLETAKKLAQILEVLPKTIVEAHINHTVYTLDEKNYEEAISRCQHYAGDYWTHQVVNVLTPAVNELKNSLHEHVCHGCIKVLVRRLLSIVEETVQKAAFNELGGLLLQVEVRSLLRAFSALVREPPLRPFFGRLAQVAKLLAVSSASEVADIIAPDDDVVVSPPEHKRMSSRNSSALQAELSEPAPRTLRTDEIRTFLHLRTDLDKKRIDAEIARARPSMSKTESS